MLNRKRLAIIVFLSLAFNFAPNKLDKCLYLNLTKSVPRGFYLVVDKKIQLGDLVVIKDVSYFSPETYLIKFVLAANGDPVCAKQHHLVIKETINLWASQKTNLKLYPICRNLAPEELFVGNQDIVDSFDSRYFGPVKLANIVAVVRPLWTF